MRQNGPAGEGARVGERPPRGGKCPLASTGGGAKQALRLQGGARRGFTLIELLVVLSIIGIMLSFTANRHSLVFERSRDAAVMIELGHVRNAVHQFALEAGGRFPPSLEDLVPKYLNRKAGRWQGARGSGIFGYDPEAGRVTLFGPEGAGPSNALDARGRVYGDY